MYSPLEIIRVGTGERRGSATSARSHLATCSSSSSPWSSSQTRPDSFHCSTDMCYPPAAMCDPSRGSVPTFAASGTSDLVKPLNLPCKKSVRRTSQTLAPSDLFHKFCCCCCLADGGPDRRQETPREATKHYRKSIDARCFQPGDDGWNLLGSHFEGVDRHVFADSSVLPVTFTL